MHIHFLLPGHKGMALTVAFAPDGKTLASGGDDKTVRLWDLCGEKPIAGPVLKKHRGKSGRSHSLRMAR